MQPNYKMKKARNARTNLIPPDDVRLVTPCTDVDLYHGRLTGLHLLKVLKDIPEGAGIAAPQVGQLERVFALRNGSIFINPKIVAKSLETDIVTEGCLSYPGTKTQVQRHKTVTVSYVDKWLNSTTDTFTSIKAIVVQHEMDHLNGVCHVGVKYKKSKVA